MAGVHESQSPGCPVDYVAYGGC